MSVTQIAGAVVAAVAGLAFARHSLTLWRLRRMMRDLDRSNEP